MESISVTWNNTVQSMHDISLHFQIDNCSTSPIPKDSSIVVLDTPHWSQSRAILTAEIKSSTGKANVTVKVQAFAAASIDTLPSRFTMKIVKPNGVVIFSMTCRTISLGDWNAKQLLLHEHKHRLVDLNLGIVGPAGCGKSSLIQTFQTVCSNETRIVQGKIQVGGGSEHVTTTLRFHQLDDIKGLRIIDTWGMTSKTFQNFELEAMLAGVLPDGWHMNLSLLAQKDALKPYAMTREHRRMHTLLIMASLNVLTNPTELEKLRTNVEMIVKVGLNSIILIARADESIPGVRENPLTNYDITKEQIAKELKVPSNRVFACVPYRNESTRGFEIERLAFKILTLAIDLAYNTKTALEKAEKNVWQHVLSSTPLACKDSVNVSASQIEKGDVVVVVKNSSSQEETEADALTFLLSLPTSK